MIENLVIVESPTKAKTITRFLGKEYTVTSCYGHIRDLKKKELSIDIKNNFTPQYEVSTDKKKLVSELKKMAAEAKQVWLATDEDREGEAIAWHLYEILDLSEEKTKRIVFHEITKSAILKSFDNPRNIDTNLVNAQQARRVLDRLVGYEVSPVLWKKIKPALSAGRVQSVAVKFIVEREQEIDDFTPQSYFKITADFASNSNQFTATLSNRPKNNDTARSFLEKCKGASYKIKNITKKPAVRKPAAPFTTSSLQQEASSILGYSVARTMRLAQQLYEAGHITYMRTDSVSLSSFAITSTEKVITSQFGNEYLKTRKFTTKSKSAQEAHEAIRPTYIEKDGVSADPSQQRLYTLIRKRTLASQMAEAKLEKKTVTISISTQKEKFVASGETLIFDGFLKVYENKASQIKDLLPQLKTGEKVDLITMLAKQHFTSHPARYNEATLVRKLEELGIGRPSTYAPTITNIQGRDYVIKKSGVGKSRPIQLLTFDGNQIKTEQKEIIVGEDKGKLFPTDTGIIVTAFLDKNFKSIMDYSFTAKAEEDFDQIALGNQAWQQMIAQFYDPFHKNVESVKQHSDKFKGERLLGQDPKTGKPVFAKIGRFGPMIQIGEVGDSEKPRFASLLPDHQIKTITLQEALELFSYPKEIGNYKNKTISIGHGKFGPYIRYGKVFISLPKGMNLSDVTLKKAIELIQQKKQAKEKKVLKEFSKSPDLQILKGRYGAYIAYKGKNYRIPKANNPEELTLKNCMDIVKKSHKNR